MRDSIIALLKGSMVLTLSNICMKAINFFLLPLYTKYLTPEQLGTSDTITTFTGLLFPILVLGLDSAYSAFYFDVNTKEHKDRVFNSILTMLIVTSIIPIIAIVFSKSISNILFNTTSYYGVVIISLLGITCNLWYLPFSLYVRLENKMTLFAIVNTTASMLMIISNIITVSVLKLEESALIISTLITNVFMLLIYLITTKKKYRINYFDKNLSKKMLKYSIPLVPMIVSSWILTSSDRVILLYFAGQFSVGLYGIAARFVNIVNTFTNSIYTAYTTFAFQTKNEKNSKEVYAVILDIMNFFLVLIVFFVSIFGKEIITLMTSVNYVEAYYILPCLLFAQLFYAANTIVSYGLAFEKKSNYMLLNISIAATVNIILNIICIPYLGALGASITTYIGYGVMLCMTYLSSQRLYKCPYNMKKLVLLNVAVLMISMTSLIYLKFINRFFIWIVASVFITIMYKDIVRFLYKEVSKFLIKRNK